MADSGAERVVVEAGKARLEVCPTLGGVVTEFSWQVKGERRHWLRPAPAGSGFPPTDAASFPLVPLSNRIRDGRYSFGGRTYETPLNFPPEKHAIHGHGWQAAWSVAERTGSAIELAFAHDGDDWPSAYEARQRLSRTGNS